MPINWIDLLGSNRQAGGQSHPDVTALRNYLENIFLENQTFTESQRRQEMQMAQRITPQDNNSNSTMGAAERNRIVKEYNEKERQKKEEEMARLIEQAKNKGLDSPIGSLEV